MAHEVAVPRLGWSMDEGLFGEWLKRDGEFVRKGEMLFVLEGEKSAQEIESFDVGVLRIPPGAPQSGDTVKVGQVLAYLCEKDEAAPFETASAKPQEAAKHESRAPQAESTIAAPSATDGDATDAATCAHASPRARRLAARQGIDWTKLSGTGRTGRIRECDVDAAAKSQTANSAADDAPQSSPARSNGEETGPGTLAVSRLRRAIASRMLAGAHETAPVTLTIRCDATNLVSLRNQFRAGRPSVDEVVPNYNELIVKLAAAVLERHPIMTARWTDREIVLAAGLHIAVAVDTEEGLVAPVIRDANQKSLRDLAVEIRRLANGARESALPESALQGGVFTITNLGMFGIDAFTPIINLPQVAILGVGAITREPVVSEESVIIRDRLTLSLSIDHRVVDGAPAARFLSDLRQAIEQPGPWLVP